jgi:protein-S-isoprenylcysteine O-methyltransferase Ste14
MLELIIALLFFVRRDPWVRSDAPLAWISTTLGGWGMLAARPSFAPVFGFDLLWFSLQLGGAFAAAISLGVLGRSFGLVAANRGVRTAGPYRIIRHPAYASYFFADVGYTLENPSVRNVALLVLVLSAQLVRIRTEEDCLSADPAYRRYCERVRYRLVPYFW